MEALVKQSTFAVKEELAAVAGTSSSSGTAVTGSSTAFETDVELGDVIGDDVHGWRTVVAIASDTALTVDAAFDTNLSSSTIKKRSFGTDPTIAAGDVIEIADFTFEPTRAKIERDIIFKSYDKPEPIAGDEEVAGNIVGELHGSGTPGTAPKTIPLWKGVYGTYRVSAASQTIAGTDKSHVKLATGHGAHHRVGEAILIDPADGDDYECVFITGIAGDVLAVTPDLSAIHAEYCDIGAGVHLKTALQSLPSLYVKFWRGDITLERYLGNVVGEVSLEYAVGAIVKPTFACQGKQTGTKERQAYALGTPTPDGGVPHVGRWMGIYIGGVLVPLEALGFKLTNTLVRRKALTTAGTQKIMRTARSVTGTFTLAYEDQGIEDDFAAGTKASLVAVSSSGTEKLIAGNTFATYMPLIKYTEVPKANQDGIYKYNVGFDSVRNIGEDTIYSSFL